MNKLVALFVSVIFAFATPITALADSAPPPGRADGHEAVVVATDHVARFTDVAMDGTSAIVVGGYGASKVIVMKVNKKGDPVKRFGNNGRQLIDVPGWGSATDVRVLPDGRLLLLAEVAQGFAVIRLTPDGRLDHTFGGDGMVTAPTNGQLSLSFTVDSRGRSIVAIGEQTRKNNPWATSIHVWRFTKRGQTDNGFRGGDVEWAPQRVNLVTGVTTDNVDRILLVTNQFSTHDTGAGISLVRIGENGGQKQELRHYSQWRSDGTWAVGLDRTSDGLLLVGTTGATTARAGSVAFATSGELAKSYGKSGHVDARCHKMCYVSSQTVTANGQLFLTGGLADTDDDLLADDSWLASITPRGKWDASFGTNGQRVLHIFDADDRANAVAQGPDGRLFVAGHLGKRHAYLLHLRAR